MAINKVVYGNNTLIDLTNDTVEASNLLEGVTAHDRSGTPVNGTAKQGHTIKDGDGTAMPTQPNLQFADANVSNDGTNNATVVRNFVDIDWDDWQEVDDNDDTYYRVTDAPLVDGNVEVDLMKKLWENPAPTASFVAQNITLASADYDFLLVLHQIHTTLGNMLSCIVAKGKTAHLELTYLPSSSNNLYTRDLAYVNDTTLSATACTRFQIGFSQTTSNDNLIPIAIYGIKQKVSISLSAIISNVSTSASKCMLSDGETSVEDTLNYSTEEHIVGKWIGSILYEKTINFGALPNATFKSVASGISNLNMLVDMRGIAKHATANQVYLPIPYASHDGTGQVALYFNGGNVIMRTSTNLSTDYTKSYVTLRYTKTS